MKRLSMFALAIALAVAALLSVAGSSDVARADPGPVLAGYDLLQTVKGSGTYQDLSFPPGMFGPGCDPWVGRVFFEGDPTEIDSFGGYSFLDLTPTDTIIERKESAGLVVFPDTIDIEIVRRSWSACRPWSLPVRTAIRVGK